MVGQVQEVNGQKVITPISGVTAVDTVQSGILSAVTSNAVAESKSYSTTEQLTGGTWINGKPIYRKVVDFGYLPNATEKNVAHNISNIDKFTHIYGVALNSSNENSYPLPFGYPANNGRNSIGLVVNLTNVRINTEVNLSPLYAYVTLEYTKTTDTATRSISSETKGGEEETKDEEIKDDDKPIEEPKEEEKK